MYLAILGVVAVISELEVLVPFEDASGHRRLIRNLNLKLFLSVFLSILAFMVGAVGVTLMSFRAGSGVLVSLGRVMAVAIPFIALSLFAGGSNTPQLAAVYCPEICRVFDPTYNQLPCRCHDYFG